MNRDNNISFARYDGNGAADMGRAFCRFLQRLHPAMADTVLAATLLTSRAYQDGHVCILLQEHAGTQFSDEYIGRKPIDLPDMKTWESQLRACPAVGYPGDYKPLILDHSNRLYFQKLWQYERNLATEILNKLNKKVTLPRVDELKQALVYAFGEQETDKPDWQKIAVVSALLSKFAVICGGPGTGKTTTIVKLLATAAAIGEKSGEQRRIALAAPTGKAAARMEQSIQETRVALALPRKIKNMIPTEAVTLHRLLGARRHRPQFTYNKDKPLPYDLIIVDEASMIDQAMISKLLDALLGEARLVLLGDKDQLASVEAGSVLGDLCGGIFENRFTLSMADQLRELSIDVPKQHIVNQSHPLTDHIILLKKNYRFSESSGIGRLTNAIKKGDTKNALDILQDESLPSAALAAVETSDEYHRILTERMTRCFSEMRNTRDIRDVFSIFNRFRILAAHRSGPRGVEDINRRIERALEDEGMKSPYRQWYDNKPVIINKNNHSMGLSNGDLGFCRRDESGRIFVYFLLEGSLARFRPSRLPDYSPAFALTIHKSQGSEFEDVLLILPDQMTRVMSRELLYTGVSRARNEIKILGRCNILRKTIARKAAQNSGLGDLLWQESKAK